MAGVVRATINRQWRCVSGVKPAPAGGWLPRLFEEKAPCYDRPPDPVPSDLAGGPRILRGPNPSDQREHRDPERQ